MNCPTKIQNYNILHQEALKSLCALQYYMNTLSHQPEQEKNLNYFLSFKVMQQVVNTLLQTIPVSMEKEEEVYPLDLLLINKNVENIHAKLKYIK